MPVAAPAVAGAGHASSCALSRSPRWPAPSPACAVARRPPRHITTPSNAAIVSRRPDGLPASIHRQAPVSLVAARHPSIGDARALAFDPGSSLEARLRSPGRRPCTAQSGFHQSSAHMFSRKRSGSRSRSVGNVEVHRGDHCCSTLRYVRGSVWRTPHPPLPLHAPPPQHPTFHSFRQGNDLLEDYNTAGRPSSTATSSNNNLLGGSVDRHGENGNYRPPSPPPPSTTTATTIDHRHHHHHHHHHHRPRPPPPPPHRPPPPHPIVLLPHPAARRRAANSPAGALQSAARTRGRSSSPKITRFKDQEESAKVRTVKKKESFILLAEG